MPLPDDQRFAVSDQVLSRELDGEAVLMDLASGTYFALNAVGTFAWEKLGRGASVGELQAQILSEFDVDADTARRDLEALLEQLLARALIR